MDIEKEIRIYWPNARSELCYLQTWHWISGIVFWGGSCDTLGDFCAMNSSPDTSQVAGNLRISTRACVLVCVCQAFHWCLCVRFSTGVCVSDLPLVYSLLQVFHSCVDNRIRLEKITPVYRDSIDHSYLHVNFRHSSTTSVSDVLLSPILCQCCCKGVK